MDDNERALPKNGQELGEQMNLRRAEAWERLEQLASSIVGPIGVVERSRLGLEALNSLQNNEAWLQRAVASVDEHRLDPPAPSDRICVTLTRDQYHMVILALANYMDADTEEDADGYTGVDVLGLRDDLKRIENERHRGVWA